MPSFSLSSKGRLTSRDLDRFPDDSLRHRIARAVCQAGCLPRKELFEAWEVARRARRLFRGGRVIDLAGGHGLLAHILLLLDDSSPEALVIDTALPPSAARLHDTLVEVWPRLAGRIQFLSQPIQHTILQANDLVVSSHACGALTDRVLDAALGARTRVAVLPCCHDEETCAVGGLAGWMDKPLAIDVLRAARLMQAGYRVWTQTIPETITPKNRLLLGAPENVRASASGVDATQRSRHQSDPAEQ